MSKIFLVTFLIIGTVIGAGFASGKEIVAFFGQTPSPLVAIPCAILIALFCAVFLLVGRKTKSQDLSIINRALFGKTETVATSFMLFNSVVSLSAMFAATDAMFCQLLSLSPLYSCILALLSSLVVYHGIDGLYKANAVLVPLLIVFIAVVTTVSVNEPITPAFSSADILSSFTYIAMNGMLAASVLVTIHDLSLKQIVISSALTGAVIGALVLLIILSLNSTAAATSSLPLVAVAKTLSPIFYGVSLFIVSAGIFTTALTAHGSLASWFSAFIKSKVFAVALPAVFCLALSFIGFDKVVEIFYPAVGVVGAVYFLVCLIYLTVPLKRLSGERNQAVHKRRKHA